MTEQARPGQAVIAGAACLDCGAPLSGPYCASCGQRAVERDPTFRSLFADAWQALVDLDGRLLLSLRTLLVRPGQLTLDYLSGRRARYLSPLRLYLLCSVAFFLIEAALPRQEEAVARIQRSSSEVTRVPGQESTEPEWEQRFNRGWKRLSTDPDPFVAEVKKQLPRVVFLLVPLHGALLALAYRNRRRRLPAHLVFALHGHAFLYIALLVAILGNASGSKLLDGALDAVTILWSVYYFPAAMQRAYGGRWRATLLRALAVGTAYAVLSGVVIMPFVLGMVWWYGGGG